MTEGWQKTSCWKRLREESGTFGGLDARVRLGLTEAFSGKENGLYLSWSILVLSWFFFACASNGEP